jgi:hypothetical protein
MKEDLFILNCLRRDFIKWAVSNEPNVYELDLNKIGAKITGFDPVADEPTVLLELPDGNKNNGKWYISVNCSSENEIGCYPIEDLNEMQIREIRRVVESWLVRKDIIF